jgi:hypothetical protein
MMGSPASQSGRVARYVLSPFNRHALMRDYRFAQADLWEHDHFNGHKWHVNDGDHKMQRDCCHWSWSHFRHSCWCSKNAFGGSWKNSKFNEDSVSSLKVRCNC